MGGLLVAVGLIFVLASFVASIMILVAAFQDELWKGLVGLLFPIYLIYYAAFEYEHEQKWLILATSLLGGGVGGLIMAAGLSMMQPH